ncbi:hypothetical protein F1363_026295 (plasmid) [Escherichia coli]|uniref:hypothetical protein n=1 Tax=Escherichia coli TaxID=562 RepID=UPI001A1E1485|nr:hypothetical protein [Escherichia coli]MBJ0123679.1 hypothetical protein [Escherichia coli]
MSYLTTNVKVGIAYATADSVITVGNPANPKAGDNSDYVPASSDNSITGTQRMAEDNFSEGHGYQCAPQRCF